MQHSVSNSEWITINMICSWPLQPHYNPITHGIFIFITILEKKMRGGSLPTPAKKGAIDRGGGGGLLTGGDLYLHPDLRKSFEEPKTKTISEQLNKLQEAEKKINRGLYF